MLALSMCPIEEEAPPRRVAVPRKQDRVPVMEKEDDTECNYVILFFIVGVIMLAFFDAM
mgnify:CR=1 FL=1